VTRTVTDDPEPTLAAVGHRCSRESAVVRLTYDNSIRLVIVSESLAITLAGPAVVRLTYDNSVRLVIAFQPY